MLWYETPSNPLLKVVNIRAVAQIVKAYNPEIIIIVDSTVSHFVYINHME